MRIIADTATLYTPEEARKIGVTTLPLNVTIFDKSYREYVDIQVPEFIELIKKGGVPQSSQPSIGAVMAAFEESDEETLVLAMADGLSGTYQSFVGAKLSLEKNDHIHVLNTRTLAGPEKYLLEKAVQLRDEGKSLEEVVEALNYSMDRHTSFLIPADFDFLMRGGRLSPLAAKIGGLIKIVPVVKESADGRILENFTVKRTLKNAVKEIISYFKEIGVDKDYVVYCCHAEAMDTAEAIKGWLNAELPEVEVRIDDLTPAFVTQGGPGCCSVQVIHK